MVEIDERLTAEGDVLTPLDADGARASLQKAYDVGIRSIAICFMHGYRHHDHEADVAAIAREIGFTQVSVSHEVSPLMKFVGRGDTTVVDAYVSPTLRRYVDLIAAQTGDARPMFMQSNGGLADARFFREGQILSGAGGIVGAAQTAQMAGYNKIIGFDMGGTSTDVAHYDGEYERAFETLVAGVRMRAPMMNIHTVAAGGGSILHFDGSRYRVGPDSAGANPGPACYRRGGPLCVTDANVMLGKIQAEFFLVSLAPTRTSRWTMPWCAKNSRRWPLKSKPLRVTGARRSKSPTVFSKSPSTTWQMPLSRFPSSAAMTLPTIRLIASAGRADSMRVWSPTHWV